MTHYHKYVTIVLNTSSYVYSYLLWRQEQLIQQKLLGSGRYGEVYQFNYENKLFAGKVIHKNLLPGYPHPSSDEIGKFIIKVGYASDLFDINQHPNIELFHSVVQLTADSPPILLTELLHENLSSYAARLRGNLTITEQINLCYDMAKGLQFLHKLNVVHGNLHGSNILISKDGQAKIADYVCPQIDTLNKNTASQYKVYMSPESILNKNFISKQCDIYSSGVLYLQVATQNPPLPADSIEVSKVQRWKEQMDQITNNPLLPLIAQCLKFLIARPHIDGICAKIAAIKEDHQITVANTLYEIKVIATLVHIHITSLLLIILDIKFCGGIIFWLW